MNLSSVPSIQILHLAHILAKKETSQCPPWLDIDRPIESHNNIGTIWSLWDKQVVIYNWDFWIGPKLFGIYLWFPLSRINFWWGLSVILHAHNRCFTPNFPRSQKWTQESSFQFSFRYQIAMELVGNLLECGHQSNERTHQILCHLELISTFYDFLDRCI